MAQFIKKFQDKPEASANDQIEAAMDPYHEMFQKCATEINKFYTPDLHDYIRNHLPELYQNITETEKRLDQLWGDYQLSTFRKELICYFRLYLSGFDTFSGKKTKSVKK